jgi:hypothetical protein
MDADKIIARLSDDHSDESLAAALTWLDSNASHHCVEGIVERIMRISSSTDITKRLLSFSEQHSNVASTVLPIVVNYSGGAADAMAAAKAWVNAHPYDYGAELLLRECLKHEGGKEFGGAALNWLGTQPETAQTADVLAVLIGAMPDKNVLAEARASLARNWCAGDSLAAVLIALLSSPVAEAFELGRSYVERAAVTDDEWTCRQDSTARVICWILSGAPRKELDDLLENFLNNSAPHQDWSPLLSMAIYRPYPPIRIEYIRLSP